MMINYHKPLEIGSVKNLCVILNIPSIRFNCKSNISSNVFFFMILYTWFRGRTNHRCVTITCKINMYNIFNFWKTTEPIKLMFKFETQSIQSPYTQYYKVHKSWKLKPKDATEFRQMSKISLWFKPIFSHEFNTRQQNSFWIHHFVRQCINQLTFKRTLTWNCHIPYHITFTTGRFFHPDITLIKLMQNSSLSIWHKYCISFRGVEFYWVYVRWKIYR